MTAIKGNAIFVTSAIDKKRYRMEVIANGMETERTTR